MSLLTRPLGTSGLDIIAGRLRLLGRRRRRVRRSAGARRTTRAPSRRSRTPWSSASTGWTRPRSTASATARRWSAGGSVSFLMDPGRWSSPSAASNGTRRIRAAEWREVTPATVRAGPRTRCAASASSTSTSSRSTGLTTAAIRSSPAWREMLKLKEEGLVRAVGVSNFDVRRSSAVRRSVMWTRLQPPFSLIGRETAEGLLPWASASRHSGPLSQPDEERPADGLLQRGRAWPAWPKDDWRRSAYNFREPALEPQPRPARRLAPDRRAARDDGGVGRRRLDAGLARRHRRHRRRPRAGAGRRLDRRGRAGADQPPTWTRCGGHQQDWRGFRPVRPAPLAAAQSTTSGTRPHTADRRRCGPGPRPAPTPCSPWSRSDRGRGRRPPSGRRC